MEYGYPINDLARDLCKQVWQGKQLQVNASRVGYGDISRGTGGFAESQQLGRGGSCTVYKVS
jgi:hypothetical protein